MNILIVSPLPIWPITNGASARIASIADGLASVHDVTMIYPSVPDNRLAVSPTRVCPGYELHDVVQHKASFAGRVSALLSPNPYHVALYSSKRLKEQVITLLAQRRYDLVYLNFIYSLQFLPDKFKCKVVLDQHNVDRSYWQRKYQSQASSSSTKLISKINLQKTMHYESKWLERIDAYVSVSHRDSLATQEYARPKVSQFFVAPNGVKLLEYTRAREHTRERSIMLGFLGSMNLQINQDAAQMLCQIILPRLQSEDVHNNYSVVVIGSNPSPSVLGLATHSSAVTVTGTVPAVLPHLRKVDLLVLPLREGAGTKLRVLEAMAAGVPIIGSRLAFDGIDGVENGKNAMIADSIDDFISIIKILAVDLEMRLRLAQAARCLVENCYDWRHIAKQLSNDLSTLV